MLGIQAVWSTLLRTGAWAMAISIPANTAVASARVMPPPCGDASARAELAGCALGRSEPSSSSATVGTQSTTSPQSPQSGDGKAEAGAPSTPAQSSTNSEGVGQNELVTLPAGTVISVRLADTVKSNHSHTGDQFSGIVDPSVLIGDRVMIPRGTEAHARMVKDKKGGRIHGHAEVQLELVSLIINGRKADVESNIYSQKRGVLASKAKPEATASANTAGSLAVTGQPSAVADPVIAAFRAAKVEKPAGSKMDFRLTASFTFEKSQVNAKP